MNDSLIVRRSQALRQLRCQANDLRLWHRSTEKPFAQRPPGNQLHRQEVHALLRTELENRGNIRMTQLSERERFFAELPAGGVIRQRACWQHFECDVAVQLLIVRAI